MSTPPPPPYTPSNTPEQRALPYLSTSGDANAYRHQQSQPYHQNMQFHGPTYMNVFCEPGNYSVQSNFPNMGRHPGGFGGVNGSANRHYFPGAGQPVSQYYGRRGNYGSQSNWANNATRMPFDTASPFPQKKEYSNSQ